MSGQVPQFQVGEVVIATNLRAPVSLTIFKASTYLILSISINHETGAFDLFLEDDEGRRHTAPETCFKHPAEVIK